MPGPFPGMDPYLEDPAFWPDVHHSLATYLRDELYPRIAPAYYAHVGERVYVLEPPQTFIPDVTVAQVGAVRRQSPIRVGGGSSSLSAAATDLPPDPAEVIFASLDAEREPYVEIRDARRGGRVVTVIEILSPSNKLLGSDRRRQYQLKQSHTLNSDTNMVEIDLLRGGAHTVAVPRRQVPDRRDWDYTVCIHRATAKGRFEQYRLSIRDRLPRIPIPLSPPDPDVTVDLQALLDRCYENGGYAHVLDYSVPPATPLREIHRAWADEQVQEW